MKPSSTCPDLRRCRRCTCTARKSPNTAQRNSSKRCQAARCCAEIIGPAMLCRGVRGATTVESDNREEILTATRQLLALMIRLNGIQPELVTSAIFSTTPDVNAEFPALAARQLGWLDVPLLCTHELSVPGSLP